MPEITIKTDKDSYIRRHNTNTNYGTDTTMWTQLIGSLYEKWGLVQFPLEEIPKSATIREGICKIYFQSADGNYTDALRRITSSWTELGVTWNNRPSYNSTNLDTFTHKTGWAEFDITDTIQGWVDESLDNYGVYIHRISGGNDRQYRTRERSGDFDPRLEIEYSAGNSMWFAFTESFKRNKEIFKPKLWTPKNGECFC